MLIPKIEESKIVFDEFVKIQRDRLSLPNSHTYNYYTLVTKDDAVVILARTQNGEFVLNEEYRHPVKKNVIGAPGGYLDKAEDPLVGAEREFIEETGYSAKKFVLMGSLYPYPGISSQKIYFVLAEDAYTAKSPKLDESEIIRTILVTEEKIREYIASGVAVDGILCTALYLYSGLDRRTNS